MTTEVKNKRGRPSSREANRMVVLQCFSELTTERSRLNKYYEMTAFQEVKDRPGLEYLADGEKKVAKWGILRELGKYPEDGILPLAEAICRFQKDIPLKTSQWVTFLREERRGERFSETISENTEPLPNNSPAELVLDYQI
jgi:hypothetical protein